MKTVEKHLELSIYKPQKNYRNYTKTLENVNRAYTNHRNTIETIQKPQKMQTEHIQTIEKHLELNIKGVVVLTASSIH